MSVYEALSVLVSFAAVGVQALPWILRAWRMRRDRKQRKKLGVRNL